MLQHRKNILMQLDWTLQTISEPLQPMQRHAMWIEEMDRSNEVGCLNTQNFSTPIQSMMLNAFTFTQRKCSCQVPDCCCPRAAHFRR